MKDAFITIGLSLVVLISFANQDSITIKGSFNYLHHDDSVMLKVYEYYHVDGHSGSVHTYKVKPKAGWFSFKIAAKSYPQYIDLILPNGEFDTTRNLSLYNYLVEKADHIEYSDRFKDRINGKGSKKWQARIDLAKIDAPYKLRARQYENTNIKKYFSVLDSSLNSQLEYLSKHQATMSTNAYFLLQLDAIASIVNYKWFVARMIGKRDPDLLKGFKESGLTDSLLNHFAMNNFSYYSLDLPQALLSAYKIKNYNIDFDLQNCYDYLAKNYSAKLRERAIVELMFANRKMQNNTVSLWQAAFELVQDKNLKAIVGQLINRSGPGAEAYNFMLENSKGNSVKLADFKGKAVVLDFWYTGCGACAQLAPVMKQIEQKFSGKNVVFITVSIDKSKSKWLKSLDQKVYTSEFTIDLFTGGEGEMHSVIQNYLVDSYPTLILIDKSGRILPNVKDPTIDKGKELIEVLKNEIK